MIVSLIIFATFAAASPLDAAKTALDEFRMQEALDILERAKSEGPYAWPEHVRLEELLGVAYAYLGKTEEAQAAFERLLALDPRHAVSYTLSPKVTFVFERAREQALKRPPPALEVSWPPELSATEPVPIDIEVASDPNRFFEKATLYYRLRGTDRFSSVATVLPRVGERRRLILSFASPEQDTSLEIYLVASNSHGDEVQRWYSEKEPRELPLRYVPPEEWYSKWWVWAVVGTAVAAAGVGTALIVTHEPDRYAGGGVHIE